MNFLTNTLTSAAIKSVSKAAYRYAVDPLGLAQKRAIAIAEENERIKAEEARAIAKENERIIRERDSFIFISYCTKDSAEMQIIYKLFLRRGLKPFAYENLGGKENRKDWEEILEDVIKIAKYMIVLFTQNIKDDSDSWVRQEVKYAKANKVPIGCIIAKGAEQDVFLSSIGSQPTITGLSFRHGDEEELDKPEKDKDNLNKLEDFVQDIKKNVRERLKIEGSCAPSGFTPEAYQSARLYYVSLEDDTGENEITLNTTQSSFDNNKIALKNFVDSNKPFVFISYSSSDYTEMKEIYDLFWGNGIPCIAQDKLRYSMGKWTNQFTETVIKKSTCSIAIITPSSPRRDSLFRQEIQVASSNSVTIVPVLMKDADEKDLLLGIINSSAIDLKLGKDRGLKKLVSLIRADFESRQTERFHLTTEEQQILESFYLEPSFQTIVQEVQDVDHSSENNFSLDIDPWKKIKRGISFLFIDFVAFVLFLATINSDSVPAWLQWLYLIVSVLIVPLYSIYLILLGVFRGVQKWYASGSTKWLSLNDLLNDLFMSIFRPFF